MQSLADDFEEEYGLLPDPVATFGSELVTAPPTPVLSSSIAGPDPLFIIQLHELIERVGLRDQTHLELSQGSSDSDEPDAAPWSLQAYATRLFERASRKRDQDGGLIDGMGDLRRPAKRQRERDAAATPTLGKRARHDQNGERILGRERAIYSARPKRRKSRSSRPQQLHSPVHTDSSTSPDGQISIMWSANTSADRPTT
ncbi:hypothetical protein MRS44_017474 [Fusarium solani]|uniref:uncharacterized protein n=1 Tax=Fusarium solani TaxID=169388 RepID=UPI0032C3F21E|nr:hypothetical protein MRS44_017474 [Fusarium solani]